MITNNLRRKLLRYGMAASFLTGTFFSNAQDTLVLRMDPAKSNGFTSWGNDDLVSTTLSIYEKSGTSYNLIVHETTTRDYIRIDPVYFNTPKYHYKLVGTKADNSTVETGYVPALPEGGTGYTEYETRVCNGNSYAYELLAFDNNFSLGIQLKAQATNNYYNTDNLVWIPYFQAIDQNNWNAMSQFHPYKAGGYMVKNIAPYLDDANFFDKMNNPVTAGVLVEKKFDQFEVFNTASTVSTADFPYTSVPNFTGGGTSWIGFFNDHVDPVTFNQVPDTTVFYTTVPTSLQCVVTYVLPDAPIDTSMNWNDWAVAYEESVRDLEDAITAGGGTLATADLEDLIHEIYVDDTEPVYTTGVTFKKYKADPYINLVKNENQLDVYSVGSSIPAGLYEVTVFSNQGKVLPLYMDVKYAIPFSPLKDYAEVWISPNPILLNDLTLKIDNKKAGNITVKLYDMNGTLLNTDSFSMNAKLVTKHYDISAYSLPSNMIIAKVTFADNSYTTVTGIK